jgi:SNF2 family DNA or RNA helicase
MDHQRQTVTFLVTNMKAFVLSTMGTGKTLSVMWAADFLMANSRISKVLIAAPLSILGAVWQREVLIHMPHRKVSILHGSKKSRLAALNKPADFYLINHDGVKVIEKELIDAGFDIFVIDELTAYKTHTATRSKSAKRVADSCRAVWGLTGGPVAQSPVDAYGQAIIVNPDNDDLPITFGRFKYDVVEKDPYLEYKFTPKLGWQDVVFKILQPSIRFELRDCVDLPETVYENREVPMSKEQDKAYKDMAKTFIAQIDDGTIVASNAGVKHMKLMQISAGSAISEDGVNCRLNCEPKIKEVIKVFNEVGKTPTIVCATFIDTIKYIHEVLSKNYRSAVVYGDVKPNDRWDVFENFQKGMYDFLIIQPRVASHGLTLTVSSTLIWFSPFPGNEVEQQTDARIIRPGQERTQRIVKLSSSPVERRQYQQNSGSQTQSFSVMEMIKLSMTEPDVS